MAKRTTCSNCTHDAVVVSVSRTASQVAFCERHRPANAETSPSYQFISKGQPLEEVVGDAGLHEQDDVDVAALPQPVEEEETKPKGRKKRSSKASTDSQDDETSPHPGESAEGSGEAHSES